MRSGTSTAPGVTTIVLAGGRSLRMGTDKAALRLIRRSLLDIALDRADRLTGAALVVGHGPRSLRSRKARIVADLEPGRGPLMGVLSGLLACETSHALALAVDMPFVPQGLLEAMAAAGQGWDVLLPRWNGGVEPLCAVYSRAVIPAIEEMLARGEDSVRALHQHRGRVRVLDAQLLRRWGDPAVFFKSLNCPDDFEEVARSILRARPSTATRPRRRADRVALETMPPPALGKEIDDAHRPVRSNHRLPEGFAHRPM